MFRRIFKKIKSFYSDWKMKRLIRKKVKKYKKQDPFNYKNF